MSKVCELSTFSSKADKALFSIEEAPCLAGGLFCTLVGMKNVGFLFSLCLVSELGLETLEINGILGGKFYDKFNLKNTSSLYSGWSFDNIFFNLLAESCPSFLKEFEFELLNEFS